MVKVSLGGEDVESSFRENVGIVSILRREDNFILLGGNSELGGESGLSDMFIIKGDGLLDPIYSRIIFCQPRHSQDYLGTS